MVNPHYGSAERACASAELMSKLDDKKQTSTADDRVAALENILVDYQYIMYTKIFRSNLNTFFYLPRKFIFIAGDLPNGCE